MTLVMVLADENSMFMSCDFRLSAYGSGAPMQDAYKLATVQTLSVHARIGVTGLGVLDGRAIGDWLAGVVVEANAVTSLGALLSLLQSRADAALSRVSDPVQRRHSFVVGSVAGTQIVVSLVSNFESFVDGRVVARDVADTHFTVTSVRPKSGTLVATGARNALTAEEIESLQRLLRTGPSDDEVFERLAEVNASVSERTPTVSRGCSVGSVRATGHGSSKAYLEGEHDAAYQPPDFLAQLEAMGIRLKPAMDAEGRPKRPQLIGSGFSSLPGTVKDYKAQVRLRPNDSALLANFGAFLADKDEVGAVEVLRRALEVDPKNAHAQVTLADLLLRGHGSIEEAESLYSTAANEPGTFAASVAASGYATFLDAMGRHAEAIGWHDIACVDGTNQIAAARRALSRLSTDPTAADGWATLDDLVGSQGPDVEVLRMAAHAYAEYLGDLQTAGAIAERAVLLDPHRHSLLRLVALLKCHLAEFHAAAYYAQRALKRQQNDPPLRAALVASLIAQQKLDGARRHLSRISKTSPSDLHRLMQAALTLKESGPDGGALDSLRTLRDDSDSDEFRAEAIALLSCYEPLRLDDLVALNSMLDAKSLHVDWIVEAVSPGGADALRVTLGKALGD